MRRPGKQNRARPPAFTLELRFTFWFVFWGLLSCAQSQTVVTVSNISGAVGDTVKVEMIVDSCTRFTAFQTDVVFPACVDYVPNSARLTARAVDHQLSAAHVKANALRLISYSLSNTAYQGVSGPVVVFDVALTSPGKAFIKLQQTVISDEKAQSLQTQIQTGTVIITEQAPEKG